MVVNVMKDKEEEEEGGSRMVREGKGDEGLNEGPEDCSSNGSSSNW